MLGSAVAFAQESELSPETRAKLDAAVKDVLAQTTTPSAQVGIVRHGRVVYTAAYGSARLVPDTPATVDMIYSIGSVSKQFTAAAAMVLVERGKLNLDDPVSTWFPELMHSHEITMRMLLNQVSGYSDYYTEDYLTPELATPTTPLEQAKRWTSKPLDFAPGTKWQYSNTNYGLAALIVEKAAGQPFFAFLQANVLKPAGVLHAIDLGAPGVPDVPQGYIHFGFGPPRATTREAAGTVFGAGELAMPISELMLWDTVVLKRGLLKPTSWQTMEAEAALPDGSGSSYGMGLFLEASDSRRVIEHSGEVNGFTALNQLYPADGSAIAVLTNAETSTSKLVQAVEKVLFAPETAPVLQHDAAAETLVKTVLSQLAQGKLDRSLLAENLSFYFTGQVIADYKDSLAGLGAVKSIAPLREFERGGMFGRIYTVQGRTATIRVFVYITKDGKLDQLLLYKS